MKCSLSSNIVKEKRFRIAGAVILSVFVIVVIVLCSTLLRARGKDESNDNNATNVPTPFTKALIVQIGNSDLWALDLDSNNSTYFVKDWKDPIHSFDLYMRETVYIGSSESGKPIKSFSEQYLALSQPTHWIADKIAVDYINGKAYILDVLASNINIFDLQKNHYNIVLSHFLGAKDIALDSIERLLFILRSSSIVRANIDGSSQRTIVNTTALSSFAIDYEGTVYYADLDSINSVNYSGHEHKIVSNISDIVVSMAALENNVFWLYSPYESRNAILYSCKIVNGVCSSFSKISFDGKLLQVKAYNFVERQVRNPCSDRENQCEHMCIVNSTDSSRCVCSIGWQLDSDSKSCKPANDFLLYVEGDHLKSRILDYTADSFTEAMLPFKLNTSSSAKCDFDFDVRNRVFIFSHKKSMYKLDLISGSEPIKVGASAYRPYAIPAIDWISNNLYFVYNGYIGMRSMFSVNSLENDRLLVSSIKEIGSLILHPNKGILFFTFEAEIKKMCLHDQNEFSDYGKNLSVSNDRNVLAIDYYDDRLYWFNKEKSTIHLSDLDGVNVTDINIKSVNIQNPVTISIYKQYLYVSTPTSVWHLDKITGENARKILPQFQQESKTIFGAKIFSQLAQPIDKSHPCVINNGDCQRYCFRVPSEAGTLQKVCGCSSDEQLNPDRKTCHK